MRPGAFWAVCWQRWGRGRDRSDLAAAPAAEHAHSAECNFEWSAVHGRSQTAAVLWPASSFLAPANTHESHWASAEPWSSALASPLSAAHLPEKKRERKRGQRGVEKDGRVRE